MLQDRPNQVRSRGPITKTRLRLLRECKDLRSVEAIEGALGATEPGPSPNLLGEPSVDFETQLDDADLGAYFGSSLPTDQNIDWSGWLDFDAENISSPPHLSPSGTSMASPMSFMSHNTTVKQERLTLSPQEIPKVKIASEYAHSIESPARLKLSKPEASPDLGTSSQHHKASFAKDSDSIHSTESRSNRSVISLGSLKKRLHSKYTDSLVGDIKSLMDRLTISGTSDRSSIMAKREKSQGTLLATAEPPMILPGSFPQYCWEHLNINQLLRCDDLPYCTLGQIYSPQTTETHRAMRSEVMFRIRSNSVRESDLDSLDAFGNSVLHIATSLGAHPSYISQLIGMGADTHCRNIAGQSFLHLICLTKSTYIAEFRILIGTLKRLKFNFYQMDDNGQTVFHALAQSLVPNELIEDALRCFQYHGIRLPEQRDNTGVDVSKRLKRPTFEMLPPPAEEDERPHRTYSMASQTFSVLDEFSSPSYLQISRHPSIPIESLTDLQNYELHADLLRTILKATETPFFEDANGRNGLHCLAAVRLDLPVSTGSTDDKDPALMSPILDLSLREQYLEQLISSGVDPNRYDVEGSTPFMAFVANVRDEEDDNLTSKILGRLCRAGANINLRNRQGETPLHLSVKLGRRAATKFLLARGANVHARTKDGTGVLALGHKHSDRASKDEKLYAQISLCTTLVASAGAVSAPTILREWASEEFRIAPDRPTPILSPRRTSSTASPSTPKAKGKGYYGTPAYGPWPATQATSWVVNAK